MTHDRAVFMLTVLAYALLGAYFLQFHRYQMSPDGISYISISQRYMAGDMGNAINAYWSPLLPWLMAPFLSLGASPIVAPKIVSLLTGVLTLYGVRLLARRFDIIEPLRQMLLISLVPVMCYFALFTISPDLLIATTLVFYLALIFDPTYRTTPWYGWACGVIGALSYFAKAFGLPFFLVHFVVFNGIHYSAATNRHEKRVVSNNLVCGLIAFVALSGSWVFLVSRKYHIPTVTGAASINLALWESGYLHEHMLIPPPDRRATSYWEDPYLAALTAPPIQTRPITHDPHGRSLPRSRLERPWTNFKSTLRIFRSFSVTSIVILAASTWLGGLSSSSRRRDNPLFYSLVTEVIYAGGYILVLVEPRYLWILDILLMIVGFQLVGLLFGDGKTLYHRAAFAILLLLAAASFSLMPLRYLLGQKWIGRQTSVLSRELIKYGIHGNVASDINWNETLILSFYNNYRYYGITGHGERGDKIIQTLKDSDIDYYFVWSPEFKLDANARELTRGVNSGLRIYSLKETPNIDIMQRDW